MEEYPYASHLYMISFLDSLCVGITLPVVNNYVVTNLHGSHLIIGFISSLQVLLQIIVSAFLNPAIKQVGVKNLIIVSQVISFLNYMILIIADDYKIFLLFRISYFLFNNTGYYNEILISKMFNRKDHRDAQNLIKNQTNLALILGPILGGLLYHNENIICVVCMLNVLIMIALVITIQIPQDHHFTKRITYPTPMITTIMESEWYTDWNEYTYFKILSSTGLAVYLMKFSLCLRTNLFASPPIVGLMISLQHLIFLMSHSVCSYIVDDLIGCICPFIRLLNFLCLTLMTLTFYILCTAHRYMTYIFVFVILALAREFVDRIWLLKSDKGSQQSVESFLKTTTCIVPLLLGALCDLFEELAVCVLSMMPLVVAMWIGITHFQNNKLRLRQIPSISFDSDHKID